ncbi:hypothetical protein C8F01DRAFT_1249424 [Mycena amicta]|nr:hypothetical protein C8F01DRAFT_1249424 [Mycena amicta]
MSLAPDHHDTICIAPENKRPARLGPLECQLPTSGAMEWMAVTGIGIDGGYVVPGPFLTPRCVFSSPRSNPFPLLTAPALQLGPMVLGSSFQALAIVPNKRRRRRAGNAEHLRCAAAASLSCRYGRYRARRRIWIAREGGGTQTVFVLRLRHPFVLPVSIAPKSPSGYDGQKTTQRVPYHHVESVLSAAEPFRLLLPHTHTPIRIPLSAYIHSLSYAMASHSSTWPVVL